MVSRWSQSDLLNQRDRSQTTGRWLRKAPWRCSEATLRVRASVTMVSRRSQSDLLNQRWFPQRPPQPASTGRHGRAGRGRRPGARLKTTLPVRTSVTMVSRRSQSDLLNQRWSHSALLTAEGLRNGSVVEEDALRPLRNHTAVRASVTMVSRRSPSDRLPGEVPRQRPPRPAPPQGRFSSHHGSRSIKRPDACIEATLRSVRASPWFRDGRRATSSTTGVPQSDLLNQRDSSQTTGRWLRKAPRACLETTLQVRTSVTMVS